MKLSASTIGWTRSDDEAVFSLLKKYGFEGVDVAPSTIWENHLSASDKEIADFKKKLAGRGLRPAGMQSLLFNNPELVIFESEEARKKTFARIAYMLEFAGKLGISAVVFGSPQNRKMGEETAEKWNIASLFFAQLGDTALAHDTTLCLEPNPESYGTDFLTTTKGTFEFVQEINHPGLRVNLDTGTMIINQEDPEHLISRYAHLIGHTHISMPNLLPITENGTITKTLTELKKAAYKKWIAIEMKRAELPKLENALKYLGTAAQTL